MCVVCLTLRARHEISGSLDAFVRANSCPYSADEMRQLFRDEPLVGERAGTALFAVSVRSTAGVGRITDTLRYSYAAFPLQLAGLESSMRPINTDYKRPLRRARTPSKAVRMSHA
jgi:hypothetical protein